MAYERKRTFAFSNYLPVVDRTEPIKVGEVYVSEGNEWTGTSDPRSPYDIAQEARRRAWFEAQPTRLLPRIQFVQRVRQPGILEQLGNRVKEAMSKTSRRRG